ncbi:MAG: hypothetical protein ACUVQV_05635 [Dissulfurimicrobium sp.]
MDTIFKCLDRMVVLADDEVAAEGKLGEILQNKHRFIMEFFGTIAP